LAPTAASQELFDPAYLRSLEGLRILARRVPSGGRLAEQRSHARGAGVEFTDVRPYVPGDDFRAVDWHLYQRLDKVFLRLFLEDEDLPVHMLLDESASMGQPPAGRSEPRDKFRVARQAIAALAYVGAHHLDRVAVHPFTDASAAPLRAVTGRSAFHRLLAWLAGRSVAAGGRTDLVRALRDFAHRRLRRGLCVVVSDFLDPEGPDAIVRALKLVPHSLLLVRIVHPHEDAPELRGELEVVDCETGDAMPLYVDDTVLLRYREAYQAFREALEGVANSRRGGYLELRTDRPVVPQLATLFRGGVLEA
jgi:uncharacterized protein (DUF58 family)